MILDSRMFGATGGVSFGPVGVDPDNGPLAIASLRIGRLDGIHGQHSDGVDGELLEIGGHLSSVSVWRKG